MVVLIAAVALSVSVNCASTSIGGCGQVRANQLKPTFPCFLAFR